MTAEAVDANGTALGIETPHQRAVKAHAEAMQRWRKICRDLREQDTKAWEIIKAHATMVPLRQCHHKAATTAPSATPAAGVPLSVATPRPH